MPKPNEIGPDSQGMGGCVRRRVPGARSVEGRRRVDSWAWAWRWGEQGAAAPERRQGPTAEGLNAEGRD